MSMKCSPYESESDPSTWLLTATSFGIDTERQPVRGFERS